MFDSLSPSALQLKAMLGGADSHLRERLEEPVQQTLASPRTVVVPGTTHFLPQERPDDVARLMGEFLSD